MKDGPSTLSQELNERIANMEKIADSDSIEFDYMVTSPSPIEKSVSEVSMSSEPIPQSKTHPSFMIEPLLNGLITDSSECHSFQYPVDTAKIMLIAKEFPSDLTAGLHEIARHCTYQNFNTMDLLMNDHDELSQNCLYLKFVQEVAIDAGKLIIQTLPCDVESDTPNVILITYNRKIEGKSIKSN